MLFLIITALLVASGQGRFLSDDYDQLLQTAKDTESTLDASKPLVMNGMYNKGGFGLPHKKMKRENQENGASSGGFLSTLQIDAVNKRFEEFRKEFEKIRASYSGQTKREAFHTAGRSRREEPSAEAQNPFATGFEIGKITERFEEFKKEFEKLTSRKESKREATTEETEKPSSNSGGLQLAQLTEKFDEFRREWEKLSAGFGTSSRTRREESNGASQESSEFELSQLTNTFEEFRKQWEKLTASYNAGATDKQDARIKREDNPDYATVFTSAVDADRVTEAFDELKKRFEELTKGEQRRPVKREEENGEGMDKLVEVFQKEFEAFIKEMEQMAQGGEGDGQVA